MLVRYFDEEDDAPSLDYLPAPGSPTNNQGKKAQDSDEEEDPLDAFMAGIEQQVCIILHNIFDNRYCST